MLLFQTLAHFQGRLEATFVFVRFVAVGSVLFVLCFG